MFQNFEVSADPTQAAPRVARLREKMAEVGVQGFLVPRSDAYRGEYVAPCDERLAWLTGFTGSAGSAAILTNRALVASDGRYTLQIRTQCDMALFETIELPGETVSEWLSAAMSQGDVLAYDPWLHTKSEIDALSTTLAKQEITLRPVENLVDMIWSDRPAPPAAKASPYPENLAGESSPSKGNRIVEALQEAELEACILTLPESISWLLNIRGADIPHVPSVQAMAIVSRSGDVQLFTDPAKFAEMPDIPVHPFGAFERQLTKLEGPVGLDAATAPLWIWQVLDAANVSTQAFPDPCMLPKACKNQAELTAARTAHHRDALAMIRFLAWLDGSDTSGLTEIDVVKRLETFRRDTNALRDISFDTICGSGPNGAIIHYRVSTETNRPLKNDRLLLVDSGGQYIDGTTDITRTIAIGNPKPTEIRAYTRVLQGLIAISRARFPKGVSGGHLDALARAPLWAEGMDYDHGTGHGVGQYLSVHEGPQNLSRRSTLPLETGMILSNEPGHYVPGEYGIRLENLIVVEEASETQDNRKLHSFETLTYVPFDRRLIDRALLSPDEITWLNGYHRHIRDTFISDLDAETADWLAAATAPI